MLRDGLGRAGAALVADVALAGTAAVGPPWERAGASVPIDQTLGFFLHEQEPSY